MLHSHSQPSSLTAFSELQLFRLPDFYIPPSTEAFLLFAPFQPAPQIYLIPPFQPGCAQLLSPEIPAFHGTRSTFPYFTPTACSKGASPLHVQFPILAHPLFWLAALPPSCLRHTSLFGSFSTVHANSAVTTDIPYSNIPARLRTAALTSNPTSAWRYTDYFLQHLQPPATQLMVLRRPGISSTPTQFTPTASNTSSTAAFPLPMQLSVLTHPLFWLAAIPPSCLRHATLLRSHSTLVTSFQHFSQAAHSCHHQQTQLCMALHRLLPPTFAASGNTADGTLVHPPPSLDTVNDMNSAHVTCNLHIPLMLLTHLPLLTYPLPF
jgi:hypothetical protein